MKLSGGMREGEIIIGNIYDKYGSKNPLVRWIMQGFMSSLDKYVSQVVPTSIHEVGCGEGYWVMHWNKRGIAVRGSDFSSQAIQLAQSNASLQGIPTNLFQTWNIYNLNPQQDTTDLIVCCEVLEHLEYPEAGLLALQLVASPYLIISVPREPLWSFINLSRGKYLSRFGNTPGHIQHWSKRAFIKLVSQYFEVIDASSPIPWTILLCRLR